MKRNVIITGGGTSEPVDSVRSITNTGTGRIGAAIADAFAADEDYGNIFFVHAKGSVMPSSDRISDVPVMSVADLEDAVRELTEKYRIDAIVHSMAVSDYRVASVTTAELLSKAVSKTDCSDGVNVDKLIRSIDIRQGKKLSSQLESPILLLEKTPKILPMLRELAPAACIVGFKLLSNVSHEELIDTAYTMMQKSGCDFVLANDAKDVSAQQHIGYLVDNERHEQILKTRDEIAAGILHAVSERMT